ncbi:M1 family metallopeptidase [Cellulophaga sp. F20128]|uniref:M1 family metallopeptidase n=1 Tax=Cellulophaga sp. F20128 TaxID=2926413 RepID=UPI001FF21BB5|nr:M1 family metallopeptidase [Cellulophaga sp. F20128]MCK0156706.1 M1 family metallopeptidase [Cellulophaga sp. F20128]
MIFYRFFTVLFICLHSSFLIAQEQDKVDFLTAKVRLFPNEQTSELRGEVTYRFTVLQQTDSVFLDAKNMQFSKVVLNNKKVKFTGDSKMLRIYKKLKKGKEYELSLHYVTKPTQTLYFFGWNKEDSTNNQIWTQGQGKYTSHWLPSFDDMNEKVEFDLSITFSKEYEVIANGNLEKTSISNDLKTWEFNMNHPMSSYLLAFAIGNYRKIEQFSSSGVPLELYYYPSDSTKTEPTYRYNKQIFNFLEEEIGVPYPWGVYKQIPVRDFLYAGMENTTATIFSDAYIVDSIGFNDKNYITINAHELAHQWFGNLVTEVDSNHHWLHEGFATYYAYLTEKELFGADHFYWKFHSTAIELDKSSKNNTGEALSNPKASSLTFYEKGAWALMALQQQIGAEAFKKGIKAYLNKNQFSNVTIPKFLSEMEQASQQDLSNFKKVWLLNTVFPIAEAKRILKETSPSIATFYKLQRELSVSKENNSVIIDRYWKDNSSIELKKRIVQFYTKFLSNTIKESILRSDNVSLRQALVLATEKITTEESDYFMPFLEDKSYVTIENILYKLWIYNPEERFKYLDKTKGVIGLSNKNVRLLWLALAIMTKEYELQNKQKYLRELQSYTSKTEYFETRQLAFSYINDLFYLTEENLKDLANATSHPVWQFKKFARNLVDELVKHEQYKQAFETLEFQIKEAEFRYIKSKL